MRGRGRPCRVWDVLLGRVPGPEAAGGQVSREGCGRGYLYKVHCGQAGARGLGEGTREPEDQAEEAAEVSPSWPSQWGNRDRAKGGEEARRRS